jgi:hypothetical protein
MKHVNLYTSDMWNRRGTISAELRGAYHFATFCPLIGPAYVNPINGTLAEGLDRQNYDVFSWSGDATVTHVTHPKGHKFDQEQFNSPRVCFDFWRACVKSFKNEEPDLQSPPTVGMP